jgi:rhamnogalacturonan endolyase
MKFKILPSLIWLFILQSISCLAQDPRERTYFYPVLKPSHENKSAITGWAKERVSEKLNRGLVVIQTAPDKVYLSWRMLADDPEGSGFHIYRETSPGKAVRITRKSVVSSTDFTDQPPKMLTSVTYFVRAVVNGEEGNDSEKTSVTLSLEPKNYHSIRFRGNYKPQRIAVADLNGDGAFDFIIKQPEQGIDPGGQPNTSGLTYKVEAYLHDGTFLWQKDLGPGIEPGIWYSPMVAWDFNGDGKAELAVKTGPEDAREADGRVRSGPEWCSVLDGMTGKELCRVDWPARSWRFGDYNRNNRNQMGVAYLDGKTPFLLVARGTYKAMIVDAYQMEGDQLQKVWRWDGDEENPVIRHQGAHNMHSTDVDGDGRDEIVLGSVVLDDNGTALWSTGYGHPDKCFVTDIDPSRPGMEIFYASEEWWDNGNGVCLVDAKTGETIWNIGRKTLHVGDGMVADILPDIPGLECFASEDPKGGSRDKYLLTAKGELLMTGDSVPDCRNWIWWDADRVRENIQYGRGTRGSGGFTPGKLTIRKYKGPVVTDNIEGTVILMADIRGDWREELITLLPGEMRIYSTTIPATDRRVSLMQDPLYRNMVAHRSMGYEQSPVTSFYLGN